jgi:undecaprenyl diphosphate synthase
MHPLADIPREKIPRHIAIIMDGNGRWAVKQGLERVKGHERGAQSVRDIVTECARLRDQFGAPDYLTLYSFSIENWRRPAAEVSFLMSMYIDYLQSERKTMLDNNIQFRQIGRLDHLPEAVMEEVNDTLEATSDHTGLTLSLALNYGSRAEITDAMKAIAEKVKEGHLDPHAITEDTINEHLYTAGMGDVDLLIRTAGEMRVSNYLLWQISYAEIVVSPTLWPEFRAEQLHDCIREYSKRNRRFGALDHTNTLKK